MAGPLLSVELLKLPVALAVPISVYSVTELPLMAHQFIEAMQSDDHRCIRAGVQAAALNPGNFVV